MRRAVLLSLAVLCVFGLVAAVLMKLMPGPLKESDYMVIGSVATLVSLLVLFLALVSTTMKASDVFFRRRRRK